MPDAPKNFVCQALQHATHCRWEMWAEPVECGRRSMLIKGNELASEIDFTIPHCVNTIEEAVAIIRENRTAWLAVQKST